MPSMVSSAFNSPISAVSSASVAEAGRSWLTETIPQSSQAARLLRT